MQPRNRARRLLIPSALFALLAVPLAGQPVTAVSFESRDLVQKQTLQGKMSFRDQVLRIDGDKNSRAGVNSMIFRGDLQVLWFLQHDKRRFIEMDKESMEQMSSQISGIMAQMQAQLEKLPPEQREAVARMMKSRMPVPDAVPSSPPEIQPSGENREVSGFPCQRYDVFQDGQKISEVWATSRSRIPGAENLSTVFQSLAEFYRSLTEGFAQFETGLNFNILAELDGFPIHTLNYENGELSSEMLILRVVQEEVDDTFFEKPEDYTQQKLGIPR